MSVKQAIDSGGFPGSGNISSSSASALRSNAPQNIQPNALNTLSFFNLLNGSENINGITHNEGIFTNTSTSTLTVSISYTVGYPLNSVGERSARIITSETANYIIAYSYVDANASNSTIMTGSATIILAPSQTFYITLLQTSNVALLLEQNFATIQIVAF